MFESEGTFNLSTGSFHTGLYKAYANRIWNAVKLSNIYSSNERVLAVNPTIEKGDIISVEQAQNYFVKYEVPQVPEPASLMLFAFGFLGLTEEAAGFCTMVAIRSVSVPQGNRSFLWQLGL